MTATQADEKAEAAALAAATAFVTPTLLVLNGTPVDTQDGKREPARNRKQRLTVRQRERRRRGQRRRNHHHLHRSRQSQNHCRVGSVRSLNLWKTSTWYVGSVKCLCTKRAMALASSVEPTNGFVKCALTTRTQLFPRKSSSPHFKKVCSQATEL